MSLHASAHPSPRHRVQHPAPPLRRGRPFISYGVTVTSGVPDEEQGLATGLATSTQQVGVTIGFPLLGVPATTSDDLRRPPTTC